MSVSLPPCLVAGEIEPCRNWITYLIFDDVDLLFDLDDLSGDITDHVFTHRSKSGGLW